MTSKKTPDSNNKFLLMALGLTLVIVLGSAAYFATLFSKVAGQFEKTNTTLVTLQAQVGKIKAVPSGKDFEAAVAAAIENMVANKQKTMLQERMAKYENAPDTVPDGKHIYGSVNARFTMVEFSDLECPYCKRFHDTPKHLVDESGGNINWQWKHLPLGFHNPAASRQAEASECVAELKGNKAFWVFLSDIFEQSRGNGQGVPNLKQLASEVGVDEKEFSQCLDSGRHGAKVQSDVAQATKLSISGTPATFLVDNKTGKSQLLGGAQPAQAFVAAMKKMMAESEGSNSAKEITAPVNP
ncbi:DsbA family protein [Eoetvoesiella caeni]